MNKSPWLSQLQFNRSLQRLVGDTESDVVIVGGGIAGISSAYFLLERTNKSVIIVEADRIAHGATGHNAGQVTSYFERHFVELVEDFGLQKAAAGQAAVEGAWILLEAMIEKAHLSVPFHQFTGYAGFSTFEQIMFRLEEESLRVQSGLKAHEILVKNDPVLLLRIPDEFAHLYKIVNHSDVLDLLETNDSSYIGVKASRKGCLNSALFCEQLVEYMEKKYGDRFSVFEHTPVTTARLRLSEVVLETKQGNITAEHLILCTNGFENIALKNEVGVDINGRFHEHLEGTIGYMAGYIDNENKPPVAISYFEPQHISRLDPYMYLTRRSHEGLVPKARNLLCLGGPEITLEHKKLYNRHEHEYPEEALERTRSFLKKTYRDYSEKTEFDFMWHGLMGYTRNGVRLIGFEPCNQRLLYNLGCNGIGILPSIYGGYRLSQLLRNEKVEESMFDVEDQRCHLPL